MSRQFQLDSLKKNLPTAICITSDGSCWTIPVLNAELKPELVIKVYLEQLFPAVPPVVKVEPIIAHKLIEQNHGIFNGHPSLKTWTDESDLGVVVSDIYKILQAHILSSGYNTHSKGISSRSVNDLGNSHTQYKPPAYEIVTSLNKKKMEHQKVVDIFQSAGEQKKHNEHSLPPCPLSFPKLEQCSNEELEFYASNPSALSNMVKTDEAYAKMESDLHNLAQLNVTLAREILKIRDDYAAVDKQYSTKQDMLSKANQEINRLKKGYDAKFANANVEKLQKDLLEEANGHKVDSENLLSKYKSKSLSWAEFKEGYLKSRGKYHYACALKEKLASLNYSK